MKYGKAIYGILSNAASVTAVVGTGDNCRVYPLIAPQEKRFPYIVYTVVSIDPDDSKDGVSKLDNFIVQVSCFGENYNQTATLAGNVRTALDRYTGTINGVEVDGVRLEASREDVEDETKVVYHISQDFKVRIKN